MTMLSMRLPAFTSDYSAAASIVSDMGGMAVLYGPTQCLENCISFDDRDLIQNPEQAFSSPIGVPEILHGDETGIIRRIMRACNDISPKFIAVLGTAVSAFMGCDLNRISSIVESCSRVPCIAIDVNGFETYRQGIFKTVSAFIDRFGGKERKGTGRTANILGYTWFDYPNPDDKSALIESMKDIGFDSINFFPGADIEDYASIGSADLNLAVSASGVDIADSLRDRYRIDPLSIPQIEADINIPDGSKVLIVGDCVASSLIAASLEKNGCVCSTASFFGSIGHKKHKTFVMNDERDLEDLIDDGGFDYLIGDPLLKNLKCKVPELILMPHPAISGRLFIDDSIKQIGAIMNIQEYIT